MDTHTQKAPDEAHVEELTAPHRFKGSLIDVLLPATPPRPSKTRVITKLGLGSEDKPNPVPIQNPSDQKLTSRRLKRQQRRQSLWTAAGFR